MSYESPISVILDEISSRIEEAEEDQILEICLCISMREEEEK